MIDQSPFSAASSNVALPRLTWRPENLAATISPDRPGEMESLEPESANEAGRPSDSRARQDGVSRDEAHSRLRVDPGHGGEPGRRCVVLATSSKGTATTVREILETSDWELVVASGAVELLAILRRAVDSGSFGGHVLIEDSWTWSAVGGELLEAVRCAVPRERIARLVVGPDVEPKDGDERVIQQPVRRAEIESLLGIGSAAAGSADGAPAGPVFDRAFWIDEAWGVSRFENDRGLWLDLVAQFAARYERFHWVSGAELRASGAEELARRVCRVAVAAAALGLQRLSSALRALAESVRWDDSGMRGRRIDELLKVHSMTFASIRVLLADEGVDSVGGPLGLVDPLCAA
jgi:hypothetical protein